MSQKKGPRELSEDTKVDAKTLNLGDINADELAKMGLDEVDPLRGIDAAYNAGQDGFLAGTTKVGEYLGTKLCVSTKEKHSTWKLHPDPEMARRDKVVRHLHHFRVVGKDGEIGRSVFGIWSAGCLDAVLKRVPRNSLLAITYEGLSEKPLKAGQSAPHLFKVRGRGIEYKITDLDAYDDNGQDVTETEAGAASAAS
jgi:hypothetical protein